MVLERTRVGPANGISIGSAVLQGT